MRRWRVHTVTWLDREVQVEGVEADDYPASRALISQLKHADKKVVRNLADAPQGYEGIELVDHRSEIDAKYSPYCIAVKIREDDLLAWAVHAWLRMNQRKLGSVASSPPSGWPRDAGPARPLPAPPTTDQPGGCRRAAGTRRRTRGIRWRRRGALHAE